MFKSPPKGALVLLFIRTMKRQVIYIFFWLLIEASSLKAFASSQKTFKTTADFGVKILGSIVNTKKGPNNIILLKLVQTKKVIAAKRGSVLFSRYLIESVISKNEFVVVDQKKKIGKKIIKIYWFF